MKTFKKEGKYPRLIINRDEFPESPRTSMSSIGYFITIDRETISPDENEFLEEKIKNSGYIAHNSENHIKLLENSLKETDYKPVIIVPISKYEHSRICYKIGPIFGFDYSNNGFFIVTEKTKKDFGLETKKEILKCIQSEIDIYNQYLSGEIYSFISYDKNGNEEDKMSGFYDINDIKDHLGEEWENENMNNYLKY